MSPEDRLSLYIDALNDGLRPPRWEGDYEWELLLETVRRVRRLAPPAMPEPDFPRRLAAALSGRLGGRRAGVRWGLRKMTIFLGTAAAVLVLCFGSYTYGRWSGEGRLPWWRPPTAQEAQNRTPAEGGCPEQLLSPVPPDKTGDPVRTADQHKEAPLVAADRVRVAPPTGREESAAPVREAHSVAGAPPGRGGGDAEGSAPSGPDNWVPVAPAAATTEKNHGCPTGSRAGEGDVRRPNEVPETGGAPVRAPAPLARGTPAAGTGIALLFGGREYRAVELLHAGAVPAARFELLGEGRARGLPDGERVPVYRRPDSVPTEVYTPLDEFWVRWVPAEPPTGETPTRGPVNGGP